MANPESRYHPPSSELKDGKFVHPIYDVHFKGVHYPSTFVFEISEDAELKDGQRIGHSLDGQVLYWSQNQVVARG